MKMYRCKVSIDTDELLNFAVWSKNWNGLDAEVGHAGDRESIDLNLYVDHLFYLWYLDLLNILA